MKSLYWISVLSNLDIAIGIITFLLIFTSMVFIISYYCIQSNEERSRFKKLFFVTLSMGLVTLILSIFIPSKKDMYIIYGVGSTIDYIKENPDALQLPDKTVQVLNKMADDYIHEKEK